ncbi:hypothetical protein B0H13DRAFT_1912703 [Mycena leptocephala]|nr:hypothetical protein B0H13DRAFT_1912703 [Mycena leptocephala]
MPPLPSIPQIRLENVTTGLTTAVKTLEVLSGNLNTPFLEVIVNTTESLLASAEGLDFFQIKGNAMTDITAFKKYAEERHQQVLSMIETLSDTTDSVKGSLISRVYSGSHNSSNSISMLPPAPQIFYGRETELSQIIHLFSQETPRIAILGTGGMGKTSLARAVLHHTEITARYDQNRYFVACDSTATKVELAGLIGHHLGLKAGRDLTRPVIQHLSRSPPTLLVLDNLETLWDFAECRNEIEEFLSLLTDVGHLALMITMRGAERPAKVLWSRPFLLPLKPLSQDAARKMFIDIADDGHDTQQVDRVLSLTDNMPLAISLLAHLVDEEGCSNVLSLWEEKKTSLLSEGYDKRSNLDLSISLSLSSPRITSLPESQHLLSLLSILPDGISGVDLVQSKLHIADIPGCKSALIRTTLAYTDEHKRLKVLVPIREYMQKFHPPTMHLVQPLLHHFQQLLELYRSTYDRNQSGHQTVGRIGSNYSNIYNLLRNGLQHGHPDLVNIIYSVCYLNYFSLVTGRGKIALMDLIPEFLPQPPEHQLEAYFIIQLFSSISYHPGANPETLIAKALSHFDHIDDTDLKSVSTENIKRQSQVLCRLSWMKRQLGDYPAAQAHAYLGNYKHTVSLCTRARDLLALCGLSGGDLDHVTMGSLAEAQMCKSEYEDARNIRTQILRESPVEQDIYRHAAALMNIAQLDLFIGAPGYDVQKNLDTAKTLFDMIESLRLRQWCDVIEADLNLREGDTLTAETLFGNNLRLSRGRHTDIVSYCLEKLGDISRWNDSTRTPAWTVVFLVHALKLKESLGIHKALQFLGDAYLTQGHEDTAVCLFTVALDGFTQMDVHCGRADCMLRLGDISREHGNFLKAVEHWQAARPLFERASQAKRVAHIDKRLAGVNQDMLDQHRNSFTHLAEWDLSSGISEDLEGMDLGNIVAL